MTVTGNVLERNIEYPHRVDERTIDGLMEVRGARAERVVLVVADPIVGIFDDIGDVKLATVPIGEVIYRGSNILRGDEYYGPGRKSLDNKPYPKEVREWVRGREIIQLGRIPRDDRKTKLHYQPEWHIWIDVEDLRKHVWVKKGLWNTPGSRKIGFMEMKAREKEFREFLRKFIRAQDAKYTKHTETEVAKKNKPLRHPKGKTHSGHDRFYFWSDALWCGSVDTDAFADFYELEGSVMDELFGGDEMEWAQRVFGEVFVEVLPDMKHALDG